MCLLSRAGVSREQPWPETGNFKPRKLNKPYTWDFPVQYLKQKNFLRHRASSKAVLNFSSILLNVLKCFRFPVELQAKHVECNVNCPQDQIIKCNCDWNVSKWHRHWATIRQLIIHNLASSHFVKRSRFIWRHSANRNSSLGGQSLDEWLVGAELNPIFISQMPTDKGIARRIKCWWREHHALLSWDFSIHSLWKVSLRCRFSSAKLIIHFFSSHS